MESYQKKIAGPICEPVFAQRENVPPNPSPLSPTVLPLVANELRRIGVGPGV